MHSFISLFVYWIIPMNDLVITQDDKYRKDLRLQKCPLCNTFMGDMPGSRDAYCPNCGYKDPCCE